MFRGCSTSIAGDLRDETTLVVEPELALGELVRLKVDVAVTTPPPRPKMRQRSFPSSLQ
jgi:hypothetical protein